METNPTKELPPITITSRNSGSDKVRLGHAIQALTDSVNTHIDEFETAIEAVDRLHEFEMKNERYANPFILAKISSYHALKAWAAERLPGMDISYGFSNRITREIAEQNFDKEASLRIVQFADDLIMVAKFCRDISELNIEIDVHSHGIEFRFTIKGACIGSQYETAERESFHNLLNTRFRDGSFKNRILATEDRIEAQSILFRKKVRLGFSPLN